MKLTGSEYFPKDKQQVKQAVIMLHGVGANGENLMPLATEFSETLPDAYFIAPNGCQEYDMPQMFNFGPAYQWFSLQDREYSKMKAGVEAASEHVKELIEDVREKFNLDYKDIFLIGFSQGSMLSLHTAITLEEEIGGVLAFSGALIVSEEDEIEINSKPPLCLVHGLDDDVVPFERSELATQTLDEWQFEVELHPIPNLAHSIDYNGVQIGKSFLKNCLS